MPPSGSPRGRCRSCSSDDPGAARARDRHPAVAGSGGRTCARPAGRLDHARLVVRAPLRCAGRHVRRRHVTDGGARLAARCGRRCAPVRRPRAEAAADPGRWWVLGAGVVLGVLLWHVAGEIGGDGLFHLARVRKLEAFDSLSLEAVDEFADGGLHPGYAFPLWHGFLALVARVAFLDPSEVVLHEASVLAPLALLVAYEAGYALFQRVGPAVAVVCAQVGVTALAPANGGAYTALGLPATASRQLLVPAAIALASPTSSGRTGGLLASVAAAGLVLAVVHPTYAIFLWLPFAGFLVVRSLAAREESRRIASALAALVLPAAAFFAWLLPVVRDTASHAPGKDDLHRAFVQYAGQLDVFSDTSYRLAPEVFGRAGAIAVAALLFVPLAGLALRRRWAAYVLGGFLAVAAVMLFSPLFVCSPISSRSRSRGGRPGSGHFLRLRRRPGRAVCAAAGTRSSLALAAGIVLQLAYPGEFDYALHEGGPALVTWIAVGGGARSRSGSACGDARRSSGRSGRGSRCVPLRCAGRGARRRELEPAPGTDGEPADAGPRQGAARGRAGRGRRLLGPRDELRIAAEAPVYIAAAPPGHVADTEKNRPYERRAENIRFFRTGDSRFRAGPERSGWCSTEGGSTSSRSSTPSIATAATRSTSCRSWPSTIAGHEASARLALLPAGGRRRRPAAAEVRPVPAGARHRDARARARQPEVDPRGRRSPRPDTGLGAPRAIHRPQGPEARGGAVRQGGSRARARPREARVAPAARPG